MITKDTFNRICVCAKCGKRGHFTTYSKVKKTSYKFDNGNSPFVTLCDSCGREEEDAGNVKWLIF